MTKSSYPAHGSARLTIDGRLLIVHGTGPGNLEMMQQYQKQAPAFREQLSGSAWVSLMILDGIPVGTAEANVILSEVVKQSKAAGLRAAALVFVGDEFNDIINSFWRNIYENEGITFGSFSTENQARDWLQALLLSE